jgi:uncharacterized protein
MNRSRNSCELRGAHVVVTGAASGVGAALAHRLSAAGTNLTLLDRADLGELTHGLGARGVRVDLSRPAELEGLIARIEAEGGPIDLLINNAGLAHVAPFVDQKSGGICDQIHTNLLAPLELTHQVLPGMLGRGTGGIVMVSSLASEISIRNSSTYVATKAGLSAFTLNLQRELARTPIRTMLMILGEVDSPMGAAVRRDPTLAAMANRLGKLGPPLEPDRIARDCIKAFRDGKQALVLPPAARPLFELRQLPNRVTDLAMIGIN